MTSRALALVAVLALASCGSRSGQADTANELRARNLTIAKQANQIAALKAELRAVQTDRLFMKATLENQHQSEQLRANLAEIERDRLQEEADEDRIREADEAVVRAARGEDILREP
jgi:hypothetical protein